MIRLYPVLCIHDARVEGIVEGSGGYKVIAELLAWTRQNS